MDLAGWLKKLTTGKIVFETTSPINGKIQVIEDVFGRRLVVEGLTQSGGQVKRVWKKALETISNFQFPISNILILGLGAGTLAKLISQKWQGVKITAVEIDPKIVEIGKKYFDLDKIPKLKIVLADAAQFVSKLEIKNLKFEIIFTDLYLGDQFPPQCETINFLKNLKSLLASPGLVVLNRLYYKDHRHKTEKFLDRLGRIFKTIKRKKVGGNLLVFAQKTMKKT